MDVVWVFATAFGSLVLAFQVGWFFVSLMDGERGHWRFRRDILSSLLTAIAMVPMAMHLANLHGVDNWFFEFVPIPMVAASAGVMYVTGTGRFPYYWCVGTCVFPLFLSSLVAGFLGESGAI